MARLTGLSLRTIANQAQMIRTENVLLRVGRTLRYALPLDAMPAGVQWSAARGGQPILTDVRAYQHWPWPLAELDGEQVAGIECGVAGHCSRTKLKQDGSAGLHTDPVCVLDFRSLYPSVFVANNICFSSLLPPMAHDAGTIRCHRTPETVGPNSRVAGIRRPFGDGQGEELAGGKPQPRIWQGSAIAFASADEHRALMPRLLKALLDERRAVKRRILEVRATDAELADVLEGRQLALKLLSNASYGFCGADTSHLHCKPLAEACLRFSNFYCRTAGTIIEENARWNGHVIYGNTDSVFVKLPGRTPQQALAIGAEMAAAVSSDPRLPDALTIEFERVLSPLLLDAHNRYAGAQYLPGEVLPADGGGGTPSASADAPPTDRLYQKGLLERPQSSFVQETILGALRRLLCDADEEGCLEYCGDAVRRLLSGAVAASDLAEGGFLKTVDHDDLLCIAKLPSRVDKMAKGQAKDELLKKHASMRSQNCVALAVDQLKLSAAADKKEGRPSIVFRLGEYAQRESNPQSPGPAPCAHQEVMSSHLAAGGCPSSLCLPARFELAIP